MTTRLSQSTPRPPPPSPSLVALLQLTPPSPILSPSDLSTSLTSGEIPILLSDGSPSLDSYQQCLLPRSCEVNLSRSTLHIADHDSAGHPLELYTAEMSASPTGTFGPVRKGKDIRHRLSLCWSTDTTTGDFIREGRNKGDRSLSVDYGLYYEDSWIGTSVWNSRRSTVPENGKEEGQVSSVPKSNLASESSPAGDESLSLRDSAIAEGCIPTRALNSKQGTPGAAQGADLIRLSRESSHRGDPKKSCGTDPMTCYTEPTLSMGSMKSNLTGPGMDVPCPLPACWKEAPDESSGVKLKNRSRDEHDADLPGSYSDAQAAAREHTFPLFLRSPRTYFRSPQGYQHYSWLQNTTITLLIDQEGFRTVRPVLKQIGIARWRLLDFGSAETDIVTFTPMTKQAFRFHYALFDGLPILRRLIVNGDETRDYLSRQAYLSLKTTGVYTVHGIEIATSTPTTSASAGGTDSHSGNQDPTKLFWQFDYSVEDWRAEQSSKNLDGEKLLVPLTFSCSPRLLHPSQGKRVKLMHIVKKTVASKLTAEKMQPPAVRSRPAVPVTSTENFMLSPPSGMQTATQLYFARSQAWNAHRRVQSNPREAPEMSCTRPSSSLHRRRASSAGEGHANVKLPAEFISPARHILPPSRLRQLLEEYHNEEAQSPMVDLVPEGPLEFFSLKPSPRLKN